VFTEPLPNNSRRVTHTNTQIHEQCAVDMGSGAMIRMPSVIKTGSGIQKLIRGGSQTHRQHGARISLLLFFQNKENSI
jgi:hypothetical protein